MIEEARDFFVRPLDPRKRSQRYATDGDNAAGQKDPPIRITIFLKLPLGVDSRIAACTDASPIVNPPDGNWFSGLPPENAPTTETKPGRYD